MQPLDDAAQTREELLAEIAELRLRLAEPEETVEAIRRGEVDAFVVPGPDGEQIYTLATADLLRQLHLVTDSLPALVAYVDRDLCFRFNSRRYEGWFGLPMRQIVGQRVVEVLGEAAFAVLREAIEEALAGQQVTCERWAVLPHLGERCLRASFVPHVPSGEVLGFVAFIEDITERRRAEDALQLLADAGELLSASLGTEETLEIGARLAVPKLADWCVLDLFDPRPERSGAGGGGRRIVSQASDGDLGSPDLDEARRHALQALRDIAPVWRQGSVAARVLRTGEPALLAGAPAAEIARALAGDDHTGLVEGLAPSSLASVPLSARGRTLGVWHLVYAESGRRHGQEELTVALELARRTAVAIDNARLYRELEAANHAKDHFLATLSHELRTPLTPVLAIASKLEIEDPLPQHVRSAFGMIRRNVELEARLIDDLLDLTRVSRGKLEMHSEALDLRQVIRQAIETCGESELAARHLQTDLAEGDHRVWGDPSRLVQVFWNLLHNAVKFTPAGGTIRLRSYVETASALAIEIADSGIGVEAAELPHIFDAFDQGHAGITRRFGGLGLGLAISRAIVERHQGSLTAASAGRDRGTTFTVRLPLLGPAEATLAAGAVGVAGVAGGGAGAAGVAGGAAGVAGANNAAGAKDPAVKVGAGERGEPRADRERGPEPATPAPEGDADAGRALHILLVEDHADSAAAMADLFAAEGTRVTVAGTFAAALAAAERGDIDLVISDLGLPDGDGHDLMRRLAGRHGLPGIALSGYGREDDIGRSRAAGFALHLTKPVAVETLRAAIEKLGITGKKTR